MSELVAISDGQTSLDPDDLVGLRLGHIATRGDLDAAEQRNVVKAITWGRRRRPTVEQILEESFVRALHRRMFGDVWSWAGTYRTTSRNLGVDAWLIHEGVGALLGDAQHWIANDDDRDALCVRVHHQLVHVHPFPNGNGRHARLFADLLAGGLGVEPFSWGATLPDAPAMRAAYIAALRAADVGDPLPLIAFARS